MGVCAWEVGRAPDCPWPTHGRDDAKLVSQPLFPVCRWLPAGLGGEGAGLDLGGGQALQRGATCHPGTSPSCLPCCSSPLWRPSFGTFTPALLSRITDNRPPLALPQDSRPPYSSDLVTPEPPSKFCGMLRVGSLCFLTFSPVWLRQWGGAGKGAPGGGSPHPRAACLHLGYVGWGW